MVVQLILNRNEERGEELKVPYHARATLTRNGNMPSVIATCLIPDTGNSSFCGCHLYIYKQTGCDNTRQCTTIPNNMRQYAIVGRIWRITQRRVGRQGASSKRANSDFLS